MFQVCLPSVKGTEFLIRDFEVCKKYIPTKILRQKCGLPILGLMERNIAICDIDCIIYFVANKDASTPSLLSNEELINRMKN